MYKSLFFLKNIFLQILSTIKVSMVSTTLDGKGGAQPFALDDKGGEWLWRSWVAIKSKGGDCWHNGTGLELWHRCCPWWQLYLVIDLSSGLQNEEKVIYVGWSGQRLVYTEVGLYKGAYVYTRTFMQGKACICWKTYLWSMAVSPWYLNLWFWTMVSRQTCWSQVLSPWYWERPKTIKEEGDLLAKDLCNELNI